MLTPLPCHLAPQFFFRLLTCATATQVVFWSSYQMLPAEVTMASSHWGYVGMVGAGAFAFIVRHFAHVSTAELIGTA